MASNSRFLRTAWFAIVATLFVLSTSREAPASEKRATGWGCMASCVLDSSR